MTFERREGHSNDVLPSYHQGAAGWMACRSPDGADVKDLIESALKAVGLRLVQITDQATISSREYLQTLDAHLADNVRSLEPGKCVVWGTIHAYLGDGEA
ncbi:MAG: hypothetical protein ISS15_10855 [Alphaproteobacteria bacterium]|nr:hypothetical protein [Alphaproteobacteria bacterium]MBL6939995.1 hypothetical protein [Alphaproteobacteria bacterium]MBL7098149.1 hypothetical protein [Alphaproteobacteria bacterium]